MNRPQKESCLITVNGKQYECATWKDFHPGGAQVLERYHNMVRRNGVKQNWRPGLEFKWRAIAV